MKRILPASLTSVLLLILLASAALAQTANLPDDVDGESSDMDDSAPVARAARLSFIQGDVSFLRAGVTEWASAIENLPLLAGDQIYAGRGARAEVQLARGNYVRLSENTELTITALSDSTAQLEITEGTAIIRIERLSSAFGRFEVDTPNTAVVIQQDGLYRVDVRGERNSELIVRNGEAEVSTEEGTFKVREGRRLLIDTATGGRLELAADATRDDWDDWSHDRDSTIARTATTLAPDYVATYETTYNDLYGADDLSSYGTWTNYSSYGQCWVPRVGADWAPYRSGQWIWIPAAGWTWLSSEPWGWAPYHYGRWAQLSGLGWAWIPGFGSPYRGFGYRDYRWRPALVYFFNYPSPRGNYVGWYPLAPGERWRRPDRSRGNNHAHLQYPSLTDGARRPGSDPGRPTGRHGITILPVEGFARGDRAARPAAPGRDVSEWINRGARGGLPDVIPAPVASAPTLGENDRRNSRRLAIPPAEITKRAVVTRNPNAGSSAQTGSPRERRWISPTPSRGDISERPAPAGGRSDRKADRSSRPPASTGGWQAEPESGGERRAPKVRIPLPSPAEKTNDEGSARERRRTREGDSAAERPAQNSGSTERTGEERRRARQERSTAPAPGNAPADNEPRVRERRPPSSESAPREDSRPRPRTDEGGRSDAGGSRDRGDSAQRAEPRHEQPRSENRDQVHQERQQQKEQRQERQQQPEQRKKP